MNKKNMQNVFETLAEIYPNADTELVRETPFQLLMAVILSAQSTDKQVNKTTKQLFQKIRTPKDIVDIWLDKLTTDIKSIGLYKSKAKNIYKTSIILNVRMEKYWEENMIPKNIQDLIKLPWVWEKTAKVVSHILYKTPVIAVDTHVHRVANRLWFVNTKQPLQTSKLLEELVPERYKQTAHHTLILFGRYHCTAKNPKCDNCPIQSLCKYYNKNLKKDKPWKNHNDE